MAETMEEQDAAGSWVAEGAGPTGWDGYPFHDPDFLGWWLQSLYLLPPDEQVAVALSLRQVLHAPALQAEIDAFVDRRVEAVPELTKVVSTGPTSAGHIVADKLREMWHTRPWMLAGGVAGLAYLVVGAACFVFKEFARIVF